MDTVDDWDIRFAYGAQELLRMAPGADGILVDHLSELLENDLATDAPVVHFNTKVSSSLENRRQAFVHVDDGAKRLSISRSLLDLRFREFLGISVGKCIRNARLASLARLLRQSHRPIAELTHDCGFSSVNSAKEIFRKRYGMSMRDYREQPTSGDRRGSSRPATT